MPGAAVRAAHGVGCSWEGVQTLLWVLTKVCWPHEVVQPCGSEVCIARCSPAERRHLCGATGGVFRSCPQATVGPQSAFAGESPPQRLQVEVPAVQRRGRLGSWKDVWVDGQGEAGRAG